MFILSIFIVAILLIILVFLPGYSYIKYDYDVVDITSKYNSYNFGKETPPFRMGRNYQFPL